MSTVRGWLPARLQVTRLAEHITIVASTTSGRRVAFEGASARNVREWAAASRSGSGDVGGESWRVELGNDCVAQLMKSGILAEEQTLRASAAQAGQQSSVTDLEWIAIPTRGRVGALARAIRSYVGNACENGHRVSVVVADDPTSPAALQNTHNVLRILSRRLGTPIHYIGLMERRRYARQLACASGVHQSVVEFALFGAPLCGEPIGINRNALLFHGVGERVLSVDDDTRCVPGRAPNTSARSLAVAGDIDPTEFWYYPSRAAAMSDVRVAGIDVLGAHTAVLGQTVAAVLGRHIREGGDLDLSRACCHAAPDIQAVTGRVYATLNGIYGDSAMHSAQGLMLCEGDSRARMLVSEDGYRMATTSREVIRQAPSLTVVHGGQFMSTIVGLDITAWLPPFMPQYRSEDTVFGATLGFVRPDAYVAHLAWCLEHAPVGRREYKRRPHHEVRVAEVLCGLMAMWADGAVTAPAEERMRSLGAYLSDVAAQSAGGFWQAVSAALRTVVVSRIAKLEECLARHDFGPHVWARDALEIRREMLARLVEAERTGSEWFRQVGEWHDLDLRAFVGAMGSLVGSWYDLMEAARALKRRGVTIGGAL